MNASLEDVLTILAKKLDKSADALIRYAQEDTIGGYHSDEDQRVFPPGSLWGVEGQVLYALVRCLRPDHVVEIGTYRGASAVHILTALERNDHGRLTSIDIADGVGELIPDELRPRWMKITGRGQDLLEDLEEAQIVFEDASHETNDVEQVLRATASLHPKVILSHDSEHPTEPGVKSAWRRVFNDDFHSVLMPPSDCGLAFKVM